MEESAERAWSRLADWSTHGCDAMLVAEPIRSERLLITDGAVAIVRLVCHGAPVKLQPLASMKDADLPKKASAVESSWRTFLSKPNGRVTLIGNTGRL
jgi:hypothetical protein